MDKFVVYTAMLVFVFASACSTTNTEVVKAPEQEKIADIDELSSRVEELNNRVYILTEQVETLRAKLKDGGEKAIPSREVKRVEPKEERPVVIERGEIKDYVAAYAHYETKKYSKALIAFSSFINKYPDGVLTDHAMYWLGESYIQQKEYALASDEYVKLLKKFPKGSKAPYAMLKIAVCYKELGMDKESKSYIEELLKRFPNSQAAEEAKKI